MLIIVSADISSTALRKLEKYGEIILFKTKNITYIAISKHPDIFLFVLNYNFIMAAPNTPSDMINKLIQKGLTPKLGYAIIGAAYPNTSNYNAVCSQHFFIHNLTYTDNIINENTKHLKRIMVKQANTRCNLIALPNNTFLTSDKGIEKVLINEALPTLYVNPRQISLSDFSHGFFGGCCGLDKKHFFINGSLSQFSERKEIIVYLEKAQLQLVELNNNLPNDIGSILIIDK